MSVRQINAPLKLRAKTAPAYRASSLAMNTSGATLGIVMSASAVIGDLALFFVACHQTNTVTPPAGVSLVNYRLGDNSASIPSIWVYSRTVQSGDPGATFTFTSSVTNKSWQIACGVYSGVGGYSVVPEFYVGHSTETLNNRQPRIPSIMAGPSDLIVGATSAYSYVTLSATASDLSTAPSGMTIRQNDSSQLNGITYPSGISLFDGAYHAPQYEWVTFAQVCYWSGVILALSPVNPRWSETEHAPSSLVGKRLYSYTNSSGAYVKDSRINFGYNTRTPWTDRLADALGNFAGSNNMALFGARAADICTYAYGTASRASRSASGEVMSVAQAGTNSALTARDTSVFVTDIIGNDALALGTSAKALKGAENAARSLFRLIRAAAAFLHTNGAVTKTGTWGTSSSDGYYGNSCAYTSTNGDKVSIAISNTPNIDIVLIGFDDAAIGSVGSTYSIKVDGVVVATGTTSDQMIQTSYGSGTNYKFVQVVVPITGIAMGSHTVEVVHTGTTGQFLFFNSFMVPAATPPWITSNTLDELDPATYTSLGVPKTTMDTYAAILKAVTEEFTDGRVIYYNPSDSGRWDYTTMISADGVHQNELGHAHYAHELLKKLSERVP